MIDNVTALSDFISFNNLVAGPNGRYQINADVTIRAGGRGGAEVLPVRLSRDSGDDVQIAIGDGGSVLVAGKLPLDYKTRYGDWSHDGGKLIIKGSYQGFDYVTEIIPAQ